MDNIETISLVLSIAGIILAIAFYLIAFIGKRKQDSSREQTASKGIVSAKSGFDIAANITVIITILLITTAIVSRAVETDTGLFPICMNLRLPFPGASFLPVLFFTCAIKPVLY
jgi:Na+/H+ antiporter NhaC